MLLAGARGAGPLAGAGLPLALLVAVPLAGVGPSVAAAQPAGPKLVQGDVTLEYRVAAGLSGCPDEAALRERAADAFDFRDPFVPPGRDGSSHLRVEITRAAGAYEGTVLVVDAQGKTLASSSEQHVDCDALVWVIGHRIALAVLRRPPPAAASVAATSSAAPASTATSTATAATSASAVAPSAPQPSSPSAPSPSPRPSAASPAPAAAPPPPSPSPTQLTLSVAAGGLFTAGLTADVGPGVWLGAAAQRGWLSLGLELRGVFPAVAFTYEPDRHSYASTISGVLVPCARWKVLSGCVFVEGGSFLFTIPGHSSVELSALLALGPRGAVDIPLPGGLSIRLLAELALHPFLPVFKVRATSAPDAPLSTWTMPPATGLFGAGIAWAR